MSRAVSLLATLIVGAALGGAGVFAWQYEPQPPPPEGPTPAERIAALSEAVESLQAERRSLRTELDGAIERERLARAEAEGQAEEHAQQNAELADENRELRARLDETAGQLTVAESARDHLAAELATAERDMGALQQNLAFFEQLIPADAKPGPVSIRAAEVHRDGDALRYRVLVMRNNAADKPFEGSLQFVAAGTEDGSSATMTLEPQASAPISPEADAAEPAALRFQQYQRVSGTLAIPPGFTPESVTVRVLEGRAVRSEHVVGLTPKESPP